MAYEYDVFLSYKRGKIREQWINETFMPHFQSALEENLPKPPRIFRDVDIPDGEPWPDTVKHALAHSKCMVAIMSPPYFFNSEWCVKEFAIMYSRQKELGFAKANRKGLILPVIINGQKIFPPLVKNIQGFDCSNYNYVGEAFKKREEYIDFQKAIEAWTENDVTKTILEAPPWNPAWADPDWPSGGIDDIIKEIGPPPDGPPTLT